MSLVASPYGLRPVQLLGGTPFAGSVRTYNLIANIPGNKAVFFGDPIGLSAGQLTVLAASPTTTVDANSPIGVFMGAEWQDPIRGFVNSQFFPANGITGGATQVRFKIMDNPAAVFRIQAAGPVTADKIGMNVALTVGSLGTGSIATGNSLVSANAAAAVTATFALKIIDFVDQPGSTPGDAFTDLLCIWNMGVHRYTAAAGF